MSFTAPPTPLRGPDCFSAAPRERRSQVLHDEVHAPPEHRRMQPSSIIVMFIMDECDPASASAALPLTTAGNPELDHRARHRRLWVNTEARCAHLPDIGPERHDAHLPSTAPAAHEPQRPAQVEEGHVVRRPETVERQACGVMAREPLPQAVAGHRNGRDPLLAQHGEGRRGPVVAEPLLAGLASAGRAAAHRPAPAHRRAADRPAGRRSGSRTAPRTGEASRRASSACSRRRSSPAGGRAAPWRRSAPPAAPDGSARGGSRASIRRRPRPGASRRGVGAPSRPSEWFDGPATTSHRHFAHGRPV